MLKALPLAVLLLFLAVVLAPLALRGRLYIVRSGSMTPALNAGDLAVLRSAPAQIAPGQVITFTYQAKTITHRVASVDQDGRLHTKGDANSDEDPWRIEPSAVKGSLLFRVPYGGYVLVFLRQPFAWVALVLIPATWVVLSELASAYRTYRQWRRESAPQPRTPSARS